MNLRAKCIVWAGCVALITGAASCTKPVPQSVGRIVSGIAQGDLSQVSLDDPQWNSLPVTPVPLVPQSIALPKLDTNGVVQLDVKALHDGHWVAFLLTWADPTPDRFTKIGEYSDGVAVQVPAAGAELPDVAMGGAQGAAQPVVIHQWKAVWKEASDGNITGVKSFYPNTWSDVYLFEMAPTEQRPEMERTYTTSVAAGNPLAHHGQAVRDLEALGFGAVDYAAEQSSVSRSSWANGVWRVLIARPAVREKGELDLTRLQYVAFAVWDGSHGEVGARKMHSTWIPIEFARGGATP